MKTLLRTLAGLAALVLLLVVIAFFLPRNYRVERAIVVNAAPEVVFPLLGDLRAWQKWSAWHERDPAMKLNFSDRTTGVGAWSQWESKSEGNGRMTLTSYEPPRQARYHLEFSNTGMVTDGGLSLAPAPGGVRVVWTTQGDLGFNPISRWFGLFLDRLIGPDFEKGLAKLKAMAEVTVK